MNLDQDIRTYFDRLSEQTPIPTRRRRQGRTVLAAKRATVGVTLAGLMLACVVTIVPRTIFGGGLGDSASVIAPPTASLPPFHYTEPTGPACPAAGVELKQVPDSTFVTDPKAAAAVPGLVSFQLVNRTGERCLVPWTPKLSIRTASGAIPSVRYERLPNLPVDARVAVKPGGHTDLIVMYDETGKDGCRAGGAATNVEQVTADLIAGAVRTVPSPAWRLRPACAVRVVSAGSLGSGAELHLHLSIKASRVTP